MGPGWRQRFAPDCPSRMIRAQEHTLLVPDAVARPQQATALVILPLDLVCPMVYYIRMDTTRVPRRPHRNRARAYPNSIRYYRIRAGLSLRQVAERLGVTLQNVQRAEVLGRGLKRYDQWRMMADLFGCSERDLEVPRDF